MPRERRLRHAKWFAEIADRKLTQMQALKDASARRVGYRSKNTILLMSPHNERDNT